MINEIHKRRFRSLSLFRHVVNCNDGITDVISITTYNMMLHKQREQYFGICNCDIFKLLRLRMVLFYCNCNNK